MAEKGVIAGGMKAVTFEFRLTRLCFTSSIIVASYLSFYPTVIPYFFVLDITQLLS